MNPVGFLDNNYYILTQEEDYDEMNVLLFYLESKGVQYGIGSRVRSMNDISPPYRYLCFERNDSSLFRRVSLPAHRNFNRISPLEMLDKLEKICRERDERPPSWDELMESLAPTNNNEGGKIMSRHLDFLDRDYQVFLNGASQEQYDDFMKRLDSVGIVWNGGKPATLLHRDVSYIKSLSFRRSEEGMMYSPSSEKNENEYWVDMNYFIQTIERLLGVKTFADEPTAGNAKISLDNIRDKLQEYIHNNLVTRYKPVIRLNDGKCYLVDSEIRIRNYEVGVEQDGEVLYVNIKNRRNDAVRGFEFVNENNSDFNEVALDPKGITVDVTSFNYVMDTVQGMFGNDFLPMRKTYVPTYINNAKNMNQLKSYEEEIKNRDKDLKDRLFPTIVDQIDNFFESHDVKVEDIKEVKLKEL